MPQPASLAACEQLSCDEEQPFGTGGDSADEASTTNEENARMHKSSPYPWLHPAHV